LALYWRRIGITGNGDWSSCSLAVVAAAPPALDDVPITEDNNDQILNVVDVFLHDLEDEDELWELDDAIHGHANLEHDEEIRLQQKSFGQRFSCTRPQKLWSCKIH
jgi:hypothetical protein